MTHPDIPLGHTIPAHRAFGWCAHCPDRTVAEELAAWQTREPIDVSPGPAADIDRLRTENERMRHELEVMYGGAFDSLSSAEPAAAPAVVEPPADQTAPAHRIAEAALAAVEAALGDTLASDAREEALAGIAAVLPEPTDRAAVLREAADRFAAFDLHAEAAALRRMADETATTETPFTPPAHYRRDDGVECCVHTIPVGPGSCPACRELADDEPAAGPTIVDQVVAALQAKAQALSVEAEEEMRRDLEEQAQVWHEAADLARRTGRKAARSAQPAAGARQDRAQP